MREQLIITVAIAAGLPFLICLLLGATGRRRAAWLTFGGVVLFAIVVPVWFELGDTHGTAGLGAVFVVLLFLAPSVIGALLGAGLGHLLGRNR